MTKPCQYNVKENWTLVNEKTVPGQLPLSKIVLAQDSGKNILLRDYETGKPCVFNLHSGIKPKELKNPKISKMLHIPAFMKHYLDPI